MRLLTSCVLLAVLAGCGSEAPGDKANPIDPSQISRIVPAQQALSTSDIGTLDPHTMNDAEISKALGEGAFCDFRYVSDGDPVLAWKSQPSEAHGSAVVKLNGVLVALQGDPARTNTFKADEIRLELTSKDARRDNSEQPQNAKLLFEVGERLKVGYDGYVVCPK